MNTYFPARTAVLLGQLRRAQLYPSVDAPRFTEPGGVVAPGFSVRLQPAAGTVYCTTDGSDPRLPGGGLSPAAFSMGGRRLLAGPQSPARFRVLAADEGGNWREQNYDDRAWTPSVLPAGFDLRPAAEPRRIALQSPTADRSQSEAAGGWDGSVANAIDSNFNTAWGFIGTDGTAPAVAVFETVEDISYSNDVRVTFTLAHQSRPGHNLGRFRLSATTDSRNLFADGKGQQGDVSANWRPLTPFTRRSLDLALLQLNPDLSVTASGGKNLFDTYTLEAITDLPQITGFRLEALADPMLPNNGPGRHSPDGNAALSEFSVKVAPLSWKPWFDSSSDQAAPDHDRQEPRARRPGMERIGGSYLSNQSAPPDY